jgi:mannose-6-phosphate isomerase-like protein (cupin superfamily)
LNLQEEYEMQKQPMFRAGDSVENPVTGERILFRETSRENGGRRVLFDTAVAPDGFVAAMHYHPYQVESFSVTSGQLGMQIAHERIVLDSGREITVMNGTPHRFWNAGAEEVVFRTEIRPALQFESLLGTMFSLAEEGRTNRKGMPNPLRLAVVAEAHFDTVRLPFPPAIVQRLGLTVGSRLGRLLGYEAIQEPGPSAADSRVA